MLKSGAYLMLNWRLILNYSILKRVIRRYILRSRNLLNKVFVS